MSDKKINFFLSVQAKICLTTIVVITVILGAYVGYEVVNRKNVLAHELNQLADITVKKLENNLRIPMWDLDTELLADTIEAEMLTDDISAILVFDSNGKDFLAGKQRSANWNVLEADANYLPADNSEVKKEIVIKNQDQKIGRVVVYVSDVFKQKELIVSVLSLITILILLDIILFVVLWVVMTNLLRKPISLLSEAANRISRGDFSVIIDTKRDDEIGIVAHSIDRLKVSLGIAIDRLKRAEHAKKKMAGSVRS